MTDILGISFDIWVGAILGAIVSAIFTASALGIRQFIKWWKRSRPRNMILGSLADNSQPCSIFVRDFHLATGSRLEAYERGRLLGNVPNVTDLWSDVEGSGISYVFNASGKYDRIGGKREKEEEIP